CLQCADVTNYDRCSQSIHARQVQYREPPHKQKMEHMFRHLVLRTVLVTQNYLPVQTEHSD
ncbi:hypothetical protein L9F63_006783, partial [Diploptera punctata]